MAIVETRDKDLLRRILMRDWAAAIYQLGDLDGRVFPDCRWFIDGDRGVLLLYTGLEVPMVVLAGDASRLVQAAPLPGRFFMKCTDAERTLFGNWQLSDPEDLYVMELERLSTVRVPNLRITPVTEGATIAPLYRHYPGNYFDPNQVPHNLYLAAEMDGELVAAAGTHAWAPTEGAAAIGNVVTAAGYRGRGIAGALIAELCTELACPRIALHVNRRNAAAIACYRRVGFRIHSEITQWTASAG